MTPAQSPIQGDPPGVEAFEPLVEYIAVMHTRYSDRKCWKWRRCSATSYVEQLPEDNGQV
jgi:hypothetical protein